jgi:hypothetical protein
VVPPVYNVGARRGYNAEYRCSLVDAARGLPGPRQDRNNQPRTSRSEGLFGGQVSLCSVWSVEERNLRKVHLALDGHCSEYIVALGQGRAVLRGTGQRLPWRCDHSPVLKEASQGRLP